MSPSTNGSDQKLLIIDCFDSFTYNLLHYLEPIYSGSCEVIRYDHFTFEKSLAFSHIVLSPGPGLPADYPKIQDFLEKTSCKHLLGVCLGLQSMVVHAGGSLEQLDQVKHGLASSLKEVEGALFHQIASPIEIGHYHSWVASEVGFPHDQYKITSRSAQGAIMSIEHLSKNWKAVQFHPESVLTPSGQEMLKNWLSIRSS